MGAPPFCSLAFALFGPIFTVPLSAHRRLFNGLPSANGSWPVDLSILFGAPFSSRCLLRQGGLSQLAPAEFPFLAELGARLRACPFLENLGGICSPPLRLATRLFSHLHQREPLLLCFRCRSRWVSPAAPDSLGALFHSSSSAFQGGVFPSACELHSPFQLHICSVNRAATSPALTRFFDD